MPTREKLYKTAEFGKGFSDPSSFQTRERTHWIKPPECKQQGKDLNWPTPLHVKTPMEKK